MKSESSLNSQLVLPCGATIKNRLAKSAMSENMAEKNHFPGTKFERLYRTWAQGGIGLCITGNVMVDSQALGEPRNVVIEKDLNNFEQLSAWAKAGTENNTALWVQLNHPGKQSPKFLSKQPVAPSAIELGPPLNKVFNRPVELSVEKIRDLVARFAFAAHTCQMAGFSGVQIHGAHGYLVSQFLSPKHNQRKDQYGGSIENRMRFVMEIYQAMREAVGPKFPIGIKINSADFQKGGFTEEDAIKVVTALSESGIDLIEISGGTYEAPIMTGANQRESTKKREAYFLDFVNKVKPLIKTPLLLTGGFRSPEFMNEVIQKGELDMIGLARALALDPEFPNKILAGKQEKSIVRPVGSRFKALNQMFAPEITWYTQQLHRMGEGQSPRPDANIYASMLRSAYHIGWQSLSRVR